MKRQYDRIVGKSGGTKAGKVFGKMVKEWTVRKGWLASKGFGVEYDKEASEKAMIPLYRITFPDKHTEVMTMEEVFNIICV